MRVVDAVAMVTTVEAITVEAVMAVGNLTAPSLTSSDVNCVFNSTRQMCVHY